MQCLFAHQENAPLLQKGEPHPRTQTEQVGPDQAGLDCSPSLRPLKAVALEVSLGLLTLKTLFPELDQPGLGDEQSEQGNDWDTRFSITWSQPTNLSASGQQTRGLGRAASGLGKGKEWESSEKGLVLSGGLKSEQLTPSGGRMATGLWGQNLGGLLCPKL